MKNLFLGKYLLFLFLSQASLAQELRNLGSAANEENRIKQLKIKSLSDLQRLTPYESVAVLQRRYLPKTFRWEFNLSISSVINHTFFYLGGLSTRVGFFLREDHGFGIEGFALLPPINKLVTEEMIGPPNNILPFTAVLSQFHGSVYYKWSPIFGKFAFLNKKIIYFDMYMTLGAGVTRVISGLDKQKQELLEDEQAFPELKRDLFPTGSLGLGQVFALSQNWAVNWELKWLYTIIQFEGRDAPYTPVDISLFVGVNYYFPEAGYR